LNGIVTTVKVISVSNVISAVIRYVNLPSAKKEFPCPKVIRGKGMTQIQSGRLCSYSMPQRMIVFTQFLVSWAKFQDKQ
jgi:hypothetical protein